MRRDMSLLHYRADDFFILLPNHVNSVPASYKFIVCAYPSGFVLLLTI